MKWAARKAERFLKAWRNVDYRCEVNGERFVVERIAAVCPAAQIVDVGANVGDWANMASRIAPGGRLVCFEPVPELFDQLQKRARQNMRSECLALSDEDTPMTITYYPGNAGLSSFVAYPDARGGVERVVQVSTGDRYVKARGINMIDLLKIDVEGYEHKVLQGFDRMLRSGTVRAIQFEYGRVNALTRFLLADFYALLEPLGYRIGKIYPNYVDFKEYHRDDEDFTGPNFLAVRRDEKQLIRQLGGD